MRRVCPGSFKLPWEPSGPLCLGVFRALPMAAAVSLACLCFCHPFSWPSSKSLYYGQRTLHPIIQPGEFGVLFGVLVISLQKSGADRLMKCCPIRALFSCDERSRWIFLKGLCQLTMKDGRDFFFSLP